MLPFRRNLLAVYHKTISENILSNVVKHGKYCETCAIIEPFGKHMKYVKYVKY